jgi:hypothetical protein
MKAGKEIIIKHPCLKNLRNNLRNIIEEAEYRKFMEYNDNIDKLEHIMK